MVDWLRSGAVVLGFMAILFWDKRPETWNQAELLYFGANAAGAYFAPATMIDFIVSVC